MSVRQLASSAAFAVSCLFLFTSICAAQETKPFRVDSYIPEKFTDLEWRVAGEGTHRSNHQRPETGQDYYDNVDSESDLTYFRASSTTRWRHFTIPREVSFSVTGQFNFSTNSGSEIRKYSYYAYPEMERRTVESKSRSFDFHFSPATEIRQYVSGNTFASLVGSVTLSYSHDPLDESDAMTIDTSTNFDPYTWRTQHRRVIRNRVSNSSNNNIGGEGAIGIGRMYSGAFAATSLYVIEELQNQGVLRREPSYEEMTRLTDTVYYYRQAHAVDARIHRQRALAGIADFLLESALIDSLTPKVAFALQDIWDYYGQGASGSVSLDRVVSGYYSGNAFAYSGRQFGYRVRLGFGGRYVYRSSHNSESYQIWDTTSYWGNDTMTVNTDISSGITHRYYYNRSKEVNRYLFLLFEYSKPLSLKWQFDGQLRGMLGLDPWSDSYSLYKYYPPANGPATYELLSHADLNSVSARVAFQYSYDLRTGISIGADLSYSKIGWEKGRATSTDAMVISTGKYSDEETGVLLLAGITYRVSIPTTLQLNISHNRNFFTSDYWVGYSEYRDDRQTDIRIGVNHQIL